MNVPSSSCICIFSSLYLPSVGGVENYTANLAHELAVLGHRVIIVTLNISEAEAHEFSDDGVEVLRLPCHNALKGRYPIPKKNRDYLQLWDWLKKQSIDYIIVNARFYPLSTEGVAFAHDNDIVPILIEHGSAHLTLGNPLADKLVDAVEHHTSKRTLTQPICCYAVSQKASAWLGHFGTKSCGELSNSIDADSYVSNAGMRSFKEELNLPADAFVVAFVGRLVAEKGILELAQATSQLEDVQPIVVLAAGTGPLMQKLKGFEGEHFKLLGSLSREDVASLLIQADSMCLPSRSEGFATSLLEAAACRTSVITTDVGGANELVPSEKYGVIIPDRNPDTIKRALEQALGNRNAVQEQGENIGELVRSSYSWKQTAEQALWACEQAQKSNYATIR